MSFWGLVEAWVHANLSIILVVTGSAVLILTPLAIAALVQALSLSRRYRILMMGRQGMDLEKLLNHHSALIDEALRRQDQTDTQLADVEKKLQLAVAGIGLVRYNAFRETGSDLSFSIALLDRNLDGVVLTSLFGREESRCYGKTVEKGKSSYFLSDEEIRALEEAGRRVNARKRWVPEGRV